VGVRDGGLDGLEQALVECAPHSAVARATGDAEEVLFVLSGSGELWTGGERYVIEPESGVNLGPGQEYELRNEASDPIRTVCVRIRAAAPKTLGEAERDGSGWQEASGSSDGAAGVSGAPGSSDGAAGVSGAPGSSDGAPGTPGAAPARVVVRRLADQQAHGATTEREFRIVADPSTGLRSATHFVGYVPPGRAPDHFHTYDEVIWVIDGEGMFHVGDEHTPLSAGSRIVLPARTIHCLENTGDQVLRLVAVFSPAGSPAAAYLPDGTPAYPATPFLTT
jgi:mannose-6-phosphate isomerase-like protein (cupin superfamily)